MITLRVGLTVIVAALAVTASGAGRTPARPAVIAVFAQSVQEFRGFVLPARQVELAAPMEEILWSVDVEESDRVVKGQVLAKLYYELQEVVVEAAQVRAASTAEIDRATLNIEDAQLTFDRITQAFERAAANELEVRRARILLDEAKASLDAAQDNRMLAEVNLRLEQRRLERYDIRAPFDGTVIELVADPGERLTDADNIVLHLADLDTLEAQVDLPIELFGDLKVGQDYVLTADEPINRELTWELKTVNPLIDTASRTFHCVFSMANPAGTLPAGFTVRLKWPQ